QKPFARAFVFAPRHCSFSSHVFSFIHPFCMTFCFRSTAGSFPHANIHFGRVHARLNGLIHLGNQAFRTCLSGGWLSREHCTFIIGRRLKRVISSRGTPF